MAINPAFERVVRHVNLHRGRMVIVKRAKTDIIFAFLDHRIGAKFMSDDISDTRLLGNFFEEGVIICLVISHYFT